MGNSSVFKRWWLVSFTSFIVVLLLLLINHSPGNNNISVSNHFVPPKIIQNIDGRTTQSSNGEFPISKLQSCFPVTEGDVSLSGTKPSSMSSSSDVNPVSSMETSNLSAETEISAENPKQENPSFRVPFPGLEDENPSKIGDKVQTGTTSSSNVNPVSSQTEKSSQISMENPKQENPSFQVPFPGLENDKQSEIRDKVDAGTTSSSQNIPLLEKQNQKASKYDDDGDEEEITMNKARKCNIFEGKWVYDPKESPLYDSAMCPFFSDTVSCRRNGRPDKEYEKWRWEAKDCKIPRFDAKDMLERLRGKRVIIVGDSINFSQFESLACLLYSAIPDRSYYDARNRAFIAESYNLVVQSHWAEFLVETMVNKTDGKKTLKIDSLSPTSRKWKDADIMLFNTGHWWMNRQRWNFVQYKRKVFVNMKIETAFRVAMKTWARWIDKNVDTNKTRVFFRSMSPGHFGKTWCYQTTKPIMDESYRLNYGGNLKEIVEKTLPKMRTPVMYLNITRLSNYRPDAHSSIYGKKEGRFLVASKQKPPAMVADCSHWCLPGIPDTWNHLLYASLVFDSSRDFSIS